MGLLATLAACAVGSSIAPNGLDFSAFSLIPTKLGAKILVTIKAKDGAVSQLEGWMKFGGRWSLTGVMDEIVRDLVDGGCAVRKMKNVVVVKTYNGSPVVKVAVDATGAGTAGRARAASGEESRGQMTRQRKRYSPTSATSLQATRGGSGRR